MAFENLMPQSKGAPAGMANRPEPSAISTSTQQINERLMVAFSHCSASENLIRSTKSLADSLRVPWIAVHVDQGLQLSSRDQIQLSENIKVARELNAEVIATTDTDLFNALQRVARQKNVTKLVIGRNRKSRWRELMTGGSLSNQLTKHNTSLDLIVLRPEDSHKIESPLFSRFRFSTGFFPYWFTLWLMVGLCVLSQISEPFIGYRAVGYLFLLGVLIVGLLSTLGPTLFAAALSALSWNYFFIPPRFTFAIQEPADIIMCFAYFIAAVILGYLTNRIKTHERILREREDRTNALYEISQDIASSSNKDEFLGKVIYRIGRTLDGSCSVVLRAKDGSLKWDAHKTYSPSLNDKEKDLAQRAFESTKASGWSTDIVPSSRSLFVPLKSPNEVVGILIYQPRTKRKLNLEQENLLYSIAQQLAVSLERHFFEKRLRESQRLEESEKLHQTLLNSISHEMRTPLTAVMGAATALSDQQNCHNPEYVQALAVQLLDASERLNRVIENLLDMSRLNSGVLALKMEWNDVHDLVGVTLKKLEKYLNRKRIEIDLPADMPLIKMDFRLMEHALSNLILNAITYSKPETKIKLRVEISNSFLYIFIEDEGPGIPEDLHSKVFDKFFRVPGTPTGGTGLGLSIVKSITEAHKGLVSLKNIVDHGVSKGAQFSIGLPIEKAPPPPLERI
jgi:two-component system sensor histidine kinase KdpD